MASIRGCTSVAKAAVYTLSVLTTAGCAGCPPPPPPSPEELAKLCKALIDLENAGGAKAPPSCYGAVVSTGVAPVDFDGVIAYVPYSVRDGLAIAGGDMILGRASDFGGPARGSIVASAKRHWPEGRIAYEIVDFEKADSDVFEQAMRDWEAVASVRFEKRTEADTSFVRIAAIRADGVTAGRSSVGLQAESEQPQALELVKPVTLRTARHELGHTLGMWHEHQRPDRDTYIDVFEANSVFDAEQFKTNYGATAVSAALWTSDYDLLSVMHYGSINGASKKDASDNYLPVLKKKDGSLIDDHDTITKTDACAVNLVYDPDRYRRECSLNEDASHCSNRADILSWSCQGPWKGEVCAHVFGTEELTPWGDDFICGDPAVVKEVRFAATGPTSGAGCVSMANPLDPHGWQGSELCIDPPLRGLEMRDGYIQGKNCIRIYEPEDPIVAWNDRYLCWECPSEDPELAMTVQSGTRIATVGTCKDRVNWVVPTDAVIKLSATAKSSAGVTELSLSGGGTLHCGGVGDVIAVPATLRNIDLRLLSSRPTAPQQTLSASAEIHIASLVGGCDHPRLSLSLGLSATRVDGGKSTEDMVIYSPTR